MQQNSLSQPDGSESAYARLLNALFWAAFDSAPFDTACTLLRVGGLQGADWDPFEESRFAFDDFNWMLDKAIAERGESAGRRVGLLMYCQAIEMTAPHEILANLLRCVAKQRYVIDPFVNLARRKKGKLSSRIPPSAKQKFRRIKELASIAGQEQLAEAIDRFFDDRVRNAFSHSDYILSDQHFRFAKGGLAQQVEVEVVGRLIAECLAFYGVFMRLHREWLRLFGRCRRFHKWPNYEVLELLSCEDEGLYGFHVHFSNGARATYTRRTSGTEATNLMFEDDGSINFFVGMLDDLEPVWKINGEGIEDSAALP